MDTETKKEATKRVITVQEVENGFMVVDISSESRPVMIAKTKEEMIEIVDAVMSK